MNVVQEIITTLLLLPYYCLEALVLVLCPTRFRTLKSVAGEIALVTGAGSGIGRLISLRLAELGASVVLWDVNVDGLKVTQALIEKAGGKAFVYRCDVSDRQLVYRTADAVREEVGEVSILVNNAGIVSGKKLLETPDERVQLTMNVNVVAHFWTIKAFLPFMLEARHGHIVTVSSMMGKIAASGVVDYCASKFAAVGLHAALSEELRDTGVELTNICPFTINTGMFDGVKTRFSAILPVLDQQDVASRIVRAIQLNENEVLIPSAFGLVLFLKSFLPLRARRALLDLAGLHEAMNTFTGHGGATGTTVSDVRTSLKWADRKMNI